ncbi:MAG: hypothetical protein K2Y17_09375 [Qipengyuania sp.]|nr:hypothetical protein [Qipengyuania sp.]
MKHGNITITQDDVDRVADRLVREAGGDTGQVNGNKVAVTCGMAKANPEFYKLYSDWEMRRTAEGIAFVQQAPPALADELKAHLARSGELLVNLTLGVTGKVVAEERQKCAITMAALGEKLAASEAELATLRAQIDRLLEANAELEVDNLRLQRDGKVLAEAAAQSEASKAELQRQHDMLLDRLARGEPAVIGDAPSDAPSSTTEPAGMRGAEIRARDDNYWLYPAGDPRRYDLETDEDCA